ncbi:MAG: phosphoribosyltransferase family protein [Flavobacteriaceae bacterium]|nr:phosphoribosyltransferase family protein [Flavobacteriaceae bacterium]
MCLKTGYRLLVCLQIIWKISSEVQALYWPYLVADCHLGAVIAKRLNWPLDVVLTKKIGHPFNKEYAIGAVSLKSSVLSAAASEVDKLYIEEETKRLRALLEKRNREYHQQIKAEDIKNKKVILVDDGIATGNTMLATIDLIHKEGASEIIVATPVAASAAISRHEKSPYVTRAGLPVATRLLSGSRTIL